MSKSLNINFGSSGDLQSVTDNGYTTSNSMEVITADPSTGPHVSINSEGQVASLLLHPNGSVVYASDDALGYTEINITASNTTSATPGEVSLNATVAPSSIFRISRFFNDSSGTPEMHFTDGDSPANVTNIIFPDGRMSGADATADNEFVTRLQSDNRILTKVLTGYTAGTNTALAATDTLLQALGKIQGQLTARVVGPATATDNAVVRFDSTTGELIQDSLITIADTGLVNIPSGGRLLVGIGDDGTSIFQVGGVARVTGTITCGGTFISTGSGGQSFQGITTTGSTGGVVGSTGTFSNHGFDFYTNNSLRGTITNTGRWWIGPALADDGVTRLQVNGGIRVSGTYSGAVQNGNTAGRPTTPVVGQMYFDTEIAPARPIWYNGTSWVDATGTNV